MAQLFANNAYGVLAGSINGAATTITLVSGHGARFPAVNGGDYFLATLVSTDTNGNENTWEIIRCTARSTDQLTVVRGQEGTTATSWNAGTRIEVRLTKEGLDNKESAITAGATSQYWRGNKTWQDFATDVRSTVLTGLSTATNAVITATDTVLTMAGKLQKQISDHFSSTANAHPASAIQLASDPTPLPGSLTAGTVQERMEQIFDSHYGVSNELTYHKSELFMQHPASVISNIPAGNIAATDVQAAINELDAEKFAKTGGQISGNVGIGVSPSAQLHVALISQITNDGVGRKSFSSLANSTNWLRLCSFSANNMPGYTRFFMHGTNHFHCMVEFSRGAGGDNVRAKITVLGFYQSYASTMPLSWRIVPEGTNAPCHIDVKSGGASSTYTIREVENVHLGAWDSTARASFPCTDVGSAATGLEVTIGTSGGGLTHREIELVPGAWRKVGMNLQPVYGP